MSTTEFSFLAGLLRDPDEQHIARPLQSITNTLTNITLQSTHLTPQTIAPLIRLLTTASPPIVHYLQDTLHDILAPHSSMGNNAMFDSENKEEASQRIASICDIMSLGVKAFLARGGRRSPNSRTTLNSPNVTDDQPQSLPNQRKQPLSSRSSRQRSRCLDRDRKLCVVTSSPQNLEVAHIIPFSIGTPKGQNKPHGASSSPGPPAFQEYFWSFVSMFLGLENTSHLRERFANLDLVENMLLLKGDLHTHFGAGRLCLIPQLSPEQEISFCPSTTAQYNVSIHFPAHSSGIVPDITKAALLPNVRTREAILDGDIVMLRTETPATHPLPHPALLALHAIVSRIIAARGGAEDSIIIDHEDEELADALCGAYGSDSNESSDERVEGDRMWVNEWISESNWDSPPSSPIRENLDPVCRGSVDEQGKPAESVECARPVAVVMKELEWREAERRMMCEN